MSALADSGGGGPSVSLAQIAAGDKKAIGRFFAANQIKYDLDNFMQIAFHGQADFTPPPETSASFTWLASCFNAHSGHLFIIDADRRIALSEKIGCQRSVEAKDVNGDGVMELVSTDSSGGTGFSSVWKRYLFFDGDGFHLGLEYEVSSHEVIDGRMIFPEPTDCCEEVWALKETQGEVEFLDVDQDGFKELAKVSYTSRYAVQNYDKGRELNGSVFDRVDEVVKDVFGERLGVEKIRVDIWDWNPVSSVYLEQ
jgi:hypothetical protein